MVSPTNIADVKKEETDSSSPAATTHNNQATHPRQGTHPRSLLIPSTFHTNVTAVTPSPISPHDSEPSVTLSTTYGSKATPLCVLQPQVQLPQPYRFQTPSYVFNTEQSNHLEQLKGSAGCNCKKSRYVYFKKLVAYLFFSLPYQFL
jgi:hypothetical protein